MKFEAQNDNGPLLALGGLFHGYVVGLKTLTGVTDVWLAGWDGDAWVGWAWDEGDGDEFDAQARDAEWVVVPLDECEEFIVY